MSHFLDTSGAGCASLEAFSRTPPFSTPVRDSNGHESGLEHARIYKSIAYMFEHLTERLQVGKLAALVNVSPSYFFALFRRQTGYAPIDFFIRLRMRRACSLLDAMGLSIKEIADVLGYEDAFYFSRLFKSVTSMAPTKYRMLPVEVRESIAGKVLPEAIFHAHSMEDGGGGRRTVSILSRQQGARP